MSRQWLKAEQRECRKRIGVCPLADFQAGVPE